MVKDYSGATAGGTKDMFGNLLNTSDGQEEANEATKQGTATDTVGDTTKLKDSLGQIRERLNTYGVGSVALRSQASALENFKQLSIRYIFTLLFGKEEANSKFGDSTVTSQSSSSYEEWQAEYSQSQTNMLSLMQSKQSYLVYSNQISVYESETTTFSAKGTVRTADGREINFNVDVGMSREFAAYYEENYGIANLQLCDPLVINFDGNIAGVSDQKFFFDLDGDGVDDEISKLNTGSGYLALDKNGDGIINDGSELFGTKSGNGFADLAAYDMDGNGWIDENDEIWSRLKIWCEEPDGTSKLYTLAEKGLGAICLGNVSTDFSLNGSNNQTNAVIRNTGIFLYENGNVGTVQHLDVAK